MSESYIKAEIVKPKWSGGDWIRNIIQALSSVAFLTLIVWWFFAAWFPHFGFTYWQLVLPVYALQLLITQRSIGRRLDK